jgi:hypothetical protein
VFNLVDGSAVISNDTPAGAASSRDYPRSATDELLRRNNQNGWEQDHVVST